MTKGYKEETPRFSLKDQLFNKTNVTDLAKRIKKVHPEFKEKAFVNRVTKKFPDLELKERIDWIAHNFDYFISKDYEGVVAVLLDSLPPELDPKLTDDDFGEFINAPTGQYVALYGCKKENLEVSLNALKEMTKRFSVEGPIRYFINEFPKETMDFLKKCTRDKNYHVRRLASEGSRPKLPWAQKIVFDYKGPVALLDKLYTDKTRYVTRSVANHMNDISKIDPDFVAKTLERWQKESKQQKDEMNFIIRHSLRTLVNRGDRDALALVGYREPSISVSRFKIAQSRVQIGEKVEFSFQIKSKSKKAQDLLIDYVLHFQKKDGSLSPKTFKIKKVNLLAGESIDVTKTHTLQPMSTKALYSGLHKIELQINGELFSKGDFTLL